MTTPLIEAIARKLASVVDYPDRVEQAAQAALTAITEAGYRIFPPPISGDGMMDEVAACYRAIIAAAPLNTKEGE